MKTRITFAWSPRVAPQDSYTETLSYSDLRGMVACVKDPAFMHGRARQSGSYYPTVLVYRRDATSPSGRLLSGSGPAFIMDRLIRKYHSTSPLSPTELRCAPSLGQW